MRRRAAVLILSVTLLVAGTLPAVAADDPVPVPTAMAALGDSITRAFHTNCGLLADCPAYSWTTGGSLDSHRTLLQDQAGTSIRGDNLAETGADSFDLAGQASGIAPDVGYVTILMGANDACTDTTTQMTSVSTFRSNVRAGLDTIQQRAPDAAVFIATVPDLLRLWEVGSTSGSARWTWWLYGICQSMLASPLSTSQADVDRRAFVRQRVVDYNTVLTEECAAYTGTCITDGGAVFGYPFQLSQLSTLDYFHPNEAGQLVLATETWATTYTFGDPTPNSPPTAEAGDAQTVMADETGTAVVHLDGSGSSDPDGDQLTYAWTWDDDSATGQTPQVTTFPTGDTTVTLTVDDGNGGTDTDTVLVTVNPYVPPPNSPPTADAGPDVTVTADEDGTATVQLDGSGSSDPDNDQLTYAWTWEGGSAEGVTSEVMLSIEDTTTPFEITLTVDDSNGGVATDTVVVTVEPQGTLHVGDLEGSAAAARRNRWDAAVTITVHVGPDDPEAAPIGDVTVSGTWSDGTNGSGTCVTLGDGTCTIDRGQIKGKEGSVTFTVTDLDLPDATYDPGVNHDPDGDSDGTTIVVAAP